MKKFPSPFWYAVLFLGWLFDFLFWDHEPGVSFALYALATLSAGVILLRREGAHPAKQTWLLFPFLLFFLAITILRREPLTVFLAHVLTLLLMAILAVTYRGGKWLEYSFADFFRQAFNLMIGILIRPVTAFSAARRAAQQTERKPSTFWPIARGLLLALPIVVIFAALLASADPLFARRLDAFVALLRLQNLPEYLFRLFYILIIAYVLSGIYLYAFERSAEEPLLGREKPLIPPFLGFTEAAIVLGSVGLLFATFVVVQFQYFFGGERNIHLEGYTYAEYARRGFGELVIVAFFSLLLFQVLSTITRRERPQERRGFSVLGVVLVALVGVILLSAYQRLSLYEMAYGFTRLRTYTHVFMIWLAILLLAAAVLDLLHRQRAFAVICLFTLLGFGISLSLLNVDAFIVRQNVERFQKGEELDLPYLTSLSTDAIPALVAEYRSPTADQATRERMAATLSCILYEAQSRPSDPSWRAWNLSEARAQALLRSVEPELRAYRVDDSDWPILVTSPQGNTFECFGRID
ncbi:MAG: DUF4173 domain-containing protein [Anaerolineales bacterium]